MYVSNATLPPSTWSGVVDSVSASLVNGSSSTEGEEGVVPFIVGGGKSCLYLCIKKVHKLRKQDFHVIMQNVWISCVSQWIKFEMSWTLFCGCNGEVDVKFWFSIGCVALLVDGRLEVGKLWSGGWWGWWLDSETLAKGHAMSYVEM